MLTSFQGMKLTILEALQIHRHKEQTCGRQEGKQPEQAGEGGEMEVIWGTGTWAGLRQKQDTCFTILGEKQTHHCLQY